MSTARDLNVGVIGIREAVIVFLLHWGLLSVFHQKHFDAPTPASRVDLLRAVSEEQTLSIDTYHTNTPDKAFYNGRYYSDKAPGLALAVLPVFIAGSHIADQSGVRIGTRENVRLSSWLSCALVIAPIVAAGSACLYSILRSYTDFRTAFWTTLFASLGGPVFPYATMLFSHSFVIGLIGIALYLSWSLDRCGAEAARRGFFIGLALGAAGVCEYSAGVIIISLVAFTFVNAPRAMPWVALGGCLGALPSLWFNYHSFGSLTVLGYSFHSSFPEMKEGIMGISLPPDAGNVQRILFGSTRGFFFWSPIFLLAFAGWKSCCALAPTVAILTATVSFCQVILIGGYWDWRAGPSLGARYLGPIVPFLTVMAGFGFRTFPRLGFLLGGLSIAISGLGTVVNATPKVQGVTSPLTQVILPELWQGHVAHNLGEAVFGANRTAFLCSLAVCLILIAGAYRCLCSAFKTATNHDLFKDSIEE